MIGLNVRHASAWPQTCATGASLRGRRAYLVCGFKRRCSAHAKLRFREYEWSPCFGGHNILCGGEWRKVPPRNSGGSNGNFRSHFIFRHACGATPSPTGGRRTRWKRGDPTPHFLQNNSVARPCRWRAPRRMTGPNPLPKAARYLILSRIRAGFCSHRHACATEARAPSFSRRPLPTPMNRTCFAEGWWRSPAEHDGV